MKCNNCRKKKSILLECKYCNIAFCSACIELDIHKCKKINECRKRKRETLENKLLSEKSVINKVIKI
jgi:hypothetical protein